ncbi:MAG: HAMP domain-containing sensor histidine kinase, partial [Acidimicrobiia bacterium]
LHRPIAVRTDVTGQEDPHQADGHIMRSGARSRRFLATPGSIARAVGLLAVFFAIILFADSDQAERVAADSQILAASERSLTSADLIRANVGIGVVLASAEAAGLETTDRWPAAIALAQGAHAQLLDQVADLSDPRLTTQGGLIGRQLSEINILLESGAVDLADETARSKLVPSLDAMTTILLSLREVVGSRIEAERSSAGNLAQATSITIAVLGPLLAVIAYRAISRRRQTELDLEEALTSERRLVVAKDQIITNLSHELRTPLTSIYGFASLLVEDLSEHPLDECSVANRVNAQIILSESADLSRMVDDLLTAVRAEGLGVMTKSETLSARSEIARVLRPFAQQGAELIQSIEDAPIWVDGLQLRQILRNLVANARRHGGPRIAVVGRIAGGGYELAVVDDGPGVPESLRARMFDRFVHRGSEPLLAGSLGLGLSIARSLAELIGGDLRYERTDGLTRFVLTVPLSTEPEEPAPIMIEAVASQGNTAEVVGVGSA